MYLYVIQKQSEVRQVVSLNLKDVAENKRIHDLLITSLAWLCSAATLY